LVDINQIIKELDQKLHIYCENCPQFKSNQSYSKIKIIQDPKYRRFESTIDMNNAIITVENEVDFKGNIEEWIEWSLEYIRSELSILNENMKKEINYHLSCAVENVISAVRYERVDSNGPKIKFLSKKSPLVAKYFTHEGLDRDLLSEEELMFDDNNSQYLMAHNGWVMSDDPLRNFAEHGL
jgi:glycogen debranching enzyme